MGDSDSRGRVLVAMSGGVDSSVTAYLLQQQGYECVGATMWLCDASEAAAAAKGSAPDDILEAAAVARQLGMPHYVLDCRHKFESQVIDRFASAYAAGLTPNPCIDCNRFLKFGYLLDYAFEQRCNWIATGHYARIEARDGRFALRCAADSGKDQSYVLHVLSQYQLAHTLLPLGEMTKSEVRAIAAQTGLPTASKGESQDICFVPDGDYVGFLERRAGHAFDPGDIVDESGTVLGQHSGAVGYTIGQRKGLGVAVGHPVYVCDKDMAANRVVVGPHESLACAAITVEDWNWIVDPRELCGPDGMFEAKAKLRYRQQPRLCVVRPQGEGCVRLEFPEPEYGVAAGQAAVAYCSDEVLGGGIIATVERR